MRAAVADFHSKYYSANLMTAAVYARHSLDKLQELVVQVFGGVANQGLKAPEFPPDIFRDEVGAAAEAWRTAVQLKQLFVAWD